MMVLLCASSVIGEKLSHPALRDVRPDKAVEIRAGVRVKSDPSTLKRGPGSRSGPRSRSCSDGNLSFAFGAGPQDGHAAVTSVEDDVIRAAADDVVLPDRAEDSRHAQRGSWYQIVEARLELGALERGGHEIDAEARRSLAGEEVVPRSSVA